MRKSLVTLALLLCACGSQSGSPIPSAADLLKSRPYGLKAPSSAAAAPLVVVLHGYGGSGKEIADDLGLTSLAAAQGFFLAMPDATVGQNGGAFWNATTIGLPPFDKLYLSAVIDDVVQHHPVDPKRVFVVGYSIGAFMAHRLACDLSPKVAAIASLAGAVTVVPSLCAPSVAVSVVEIHGDADQVITSGSS